MLQFKKAFWGRRPGFDIGDVLHVVTNIGFVVLVYLSSVSWQLPLIGFGLVFVSKWRIFAVKPRFWLPNLSANLVDTVFGLSMVGLLLYAESTGLAIGLAALYLIWLLFIKPQGGELMVGLQASLALLLGLLVICMTPWLVNLPGLATLLCYMVAFGAVRHFLGNYETEDGRLISSTMAYMAAQLSWFGLLWSQSYRFLGLNISLSSLMVWVTLFTFGLMYAAERKKALTRGVIAENLLFGGALLAVLFISAQWSVSL